MSSLSGKVVLITGAGSGIGATTACHLAGYKTRLALVGRNMKGLRDTVTHCQKKGLNDAQVLPFEANLLRESDIEHTVTSVISAFGKLDVLVNNAGVSIFSDLQSTKMCEWDEMMNINVKAPFLLSRQCLPHLVDTKGCIINVSSVQAQLGMPQCMAYSMGKAALDQFSRILAADIGKHNVRVNSISPGFTISDIHLKNGMKPDIYKEYTELQTVQTPLGRCGVPLDIAKVIAFLASDEAAFITGEIIRVDGGRGVTAPVIRSLLARQLKSPASDCSQ